MSFLSNEAARALLTEVEKIPNAAMTFARNEVAKLETAFDARFTTMEAKLRAVTSDGISDLDSRVEAALAKLDGGGLDLSSLKSAIGGLTTGASDSARDATDPSADASLRADLSSLAPSKALDGAARINEPSQVAQKVDPATAGKQAADAAVAAGRDPVPAAAAAAHAAAVAVDADPIAAATEAATAAGADPISAERAAQNAAATA